MDFSDELRVAKDAAREAGRIMQQYQRDGFSVDHKDTYTDIVTEADVQCQEAIISRINDAFPDDGFLAEENEQTPDGEDRVWVIDPIDGTKNFAHGFPFYCTSIALQVDGESQVGVVYTPENDELFAAVRGEGATVNGTAITVSRINDLRDALVLARLTSRNADIRKKESAFLEAVLQRPSSFRRPGSAALDLCHIACGRADAHALVTINPWDIAAGTLIVEEAGGAVRTQEAIIDGYVEIVASNGTLQDDITALFDEHVRNTDH